jgi:hypothetical protein
MKISWVVSDNFVLDPTIDLSRLKEIGSIWGSWRTWRATQTDNVVCHDLQKAEELIKRTFQSICNFYIPNSVFMKLNRPSGVNLYEGDFIHEVDCHEEIVAMHLAAATSDIVLLTGFDFSQKDKSEDRLIAHKFQNYQQLVKHVIRSNKNIQWVLVDHFDPLATIYSELENLTSDSLDNILNVLK